VKDQASAKGQDKVAQAEEPSESVSEIDEILVVEPFPRWEVVQDQ